LCGRDARQAGPLPSPIGHEDRRLPSLFSHTPLRPGWKLDVPVPSAATPRSGAIPKDALIRVRHCPKADRADSAPADPLSPLSTRRQWEKGRTLERRHREEQTKRSETGRR